MPLIEFLKSNPDAVGKLSISQIVSTAGDGNLRDDSNCSSELREYLRSANSHKISEYIEQCLLSKIEKGGFILQDLVNELGRRLEYKVSNGRYQGVSNGIGFDGIWESPEGNSIVVEVKTTDVYRISLDVIVDYKTKLLAHSKIGENSSVLIVVGRQDTGELEAQVRGSRHAWDVRLISAESLIKMVILKENSEEAETDLKIRSILAPVEYTRLDRLVDVMFTTAIDISPSKTSSDADYDEMNGALYNIDETSSRILSDKVRGVWDFTEPQLLSAQRERIIKTISRKLDISFIKKSKALFWDKDHSTRVACTISKEHIRRPSHPYWYAHHPKWDEFLSEGQQGFLILGCMGLSEAFVIPIKDFQKIIPKLNMTDNDNVRYWHIHITTNAKKEYEIIVPKSNGNFSLTKYQMPLD